MNFKRSDPVNTLLQYYSQTIHGVSLPNIGQVLLQCTSSTMRHSHQLPLSSITSTINNFYQLPSILLLCRICKRSRLSSICYWNRLSVRLYIEPEYGPPVTVSCSYSMSGGVQCFQASSRDVRNPIRATPRLSELSVLLLGKR